jgi:hypothetical protein
MNDEQQRPEDWAVTFTYEAASDEGSLEKLGNELESHDASVAAVPPDRVTVTTHVSAHDVVGAIACASAMIAAIVVAVLGMAVVVAVEAMTEAEYERQADAPTLPVLLGASEVGEMLGVSRQRVHQLRNLSTFPAPLVVVAMGPLWEERAIEAFKREWSRRPGRPRLAVAQ